MKSARLWLVWAAALPAAAWAHQVSDELGVGSQQPTQTSPRSGFIYDRLGAVFDLNDTWSLRGDFMLTHDDATPAEEGAQFGTSGGDIPFFDLGAEFNPNDHITSALELDLSPKSTQYNDAPIQVNGPDGGVLNEDANVKSVSSSIGFLFNFGLQTAGDSNFEAAGNASVGVTAFGSTQSIQQVASSLGVFNLTLARDQCQALRARGLDRKGCAALLGDPSDLTQGRVALNLTAILFQDSEAALSGAYYVYNKDPTTVGYYSVTTAGRLSAGYQFGQGLAIAPYLWTIRPDLSHRFFDRLRLDLSYQYGQYWPGQGSSNTVGLRADFKFNRAWKAWASVTLERDVDGSGNVTPSSAVTVGARYRF